MDVSGANSAIGGEDVENLYETLDKLVDSAKGVPAFVPEEDINLSDLMGLIDGGGDNNKVVLEVAEGDIGGVKCEYGDNADSEGLDSTEATDGGDAGKDSAPQVDCGGVDDSVITIDNPVEVVKATESPSVSDSASGSVGGDAKRASESGCSGATVGDAKSASESGCSGATVGPTQTIPKYRLREIFRHANGNIYKLPCYYPLYR